MAATLCAGGHAGLCVLARKQSLGAQTPNLTYQETAALSFGGLAALYFLRDKAKLQEKGSKFSSSARRAESERRWCRLLNTMGLKSQVYAAQKPRSVKSLGADYVVDYTQEDVTKNGKTYDVIADTVCGKASFARYKGSLKPSGLYLAVAGGLREMGQTLWTSIRGGKKVISGMGGEHNKDLDFLKELAEAGHLNRSSINRTRWNRLPTPTAMRIPGANAAMS